MEIGLKRSRRQSGDSFRGQTQSQYLSIGSDEKGKDGKAEAEATRQSSHAIVSEYSFTYGIEALHKTFSIKILLSTKFLARCNHQLPWQKKTPIISS